jgi:predicted O-methyltransferase YrrM
MTTRHATGFLTGESARPARRWAALLAIGAVQWPWLLRSLSGGGAAARDALLRRLRLPDEALPALGSWKADAGFLALVTDHILSRRPKLVVEFGAGATTLVAARALELAGGGRLLSFEQHADFATATRGRLAEYGLRAEIRAVPLAPIEGRPGLWYDHGPLPRGIDLMLVDGPPWTVHPLTRDGAASLFGKLAPAGTIMLDDAARPGERLVARRWRRDWPGMDFRFVRAGSKGTLLGTRRA